MHRDPFKSFEQALLRDLKARSIARAKILVACSGGVDSVALLFSLNKIKRALRLELSVGHVHHGFSPDPFIESYRREAWETAREHAERLNLPFFSNSRDGSLTDNASKTEAGLRELRHRCLQTWREEAGAKWVATAHHAGDVLETRLMRLIRGTGTQGFASFGFFGKHLIRPLLRFDKKEIEIYGQTLDHVADPSNLHLDPFRNWLRREWLAVLERRFPGGTRNLAASFEQLAEELGPVAPDASKSLMTGGAINRTEFLATPENRRRTLLASYCRDLGLKNYTRGHIEELARRLDGAQNEFRFELVQCVWEISRDLIRASRV